MDGLLKLVREAEQTAEARTCERDGHMWESDSARLCPRGGSGCSQSFYVCRRCGEEDYGEPGGPGHADCFVQHGPHDRCDGTDPRNDEQFTYEAQELQS